MWCIRVCPNGKAKKGDFALSLQLCGVPKFADHFPVTWTILCSAVNVKCRYTTPFTLEQSCYLWGNGMLSFDKFRKCNNFSIVVDIQIDDEKNANAMVEWEQFVADQSNGGGGPPGLRSRRSRDRDHISAPEPTPPPNPIQMAKQQVHCSYISPLHCDLEYMIHRAFVPLTSDVLCSDRLDCVQTDERRNAGTTSGGTR